MTGQPQDHGGGTGGRYATRTRKGMAMLQRMVEAGGMAPEDLQRAKAFAQSIIELENASVRDKLRANELVMAISKHTAAMGIELERLERLDAGEATERVEQHTVTVPKVARLDDE
ncbi:MAG: hypothetical protein B7733_13020 [Myxococcales bacterium FL481]|nr:MAG: hypothetical protein B7733_13020 [Myxococcales bacterium FL481]